MLLKSICYKDFRPFKGNQYIDLTPKDDDTDATVTIIIETIELAHEGWEEVDIK